MKRLYLFLQTHASLILLLFATGAFAQSGNIKGVVTDADGPLYGATVLVEGTTIGTVTDFDGNYSIAVEPGTYTIEVSYIGYATTTQSVTVNSGAASELDVVMSEGLLVDEVVVIGSRSAGRTKLETPVPVDVIDMSKLTNSAPQTDLNQLLNQTVPSFSSNTQTISDGTDHIDPASLRGLGPDQVLVLINGKRRHTTSLVNVNGTFGRGNVGTDLNAIPAIALTKLEVLRDGAAAKYGSYAIAGVMNFNLRRDVNRLQLSVSAGANFTNSDNIGPFMGEERSVDGGKVDVGVNYGLPLGNSGGFINVSGEFNYRDWSNRMREFSGGIFNGYSAVEWVAFQDGADLSTLDLDEIKGYAQSVSHFDSGLKSSIQGAADMDELQGLLDFDATEAELAARGQSRTDYNMRVGQSGLRGGKFFANMSIPLQNDLEVYAFGGMSYRRGNSGCFYRLPGQQRTTTAIYVNGTVPEINSNIKDGSISGGIRGKIGDWNLDFSNTYGRNEFLFHMTETHNATLGASSPTSFDAGGHHFTQSTTNFDVSQYFDDVGSLMGINLAFGAEYRYENFGIEPGTELSYGNYDVNGNLVNPVTPDNLLTVDFFGRNRPSGAQCFAGFLPTNFVDANRSSVAGYVDGEFDFSREFLLGAAIRFENYSDFGSTFNYKVAGRYIFSDNFVFRAAHSTGFRAPSLHQIHFSRTSTIFVLNDMGESVPNERGTFANTSRAAQLLGIPELKEETSQSFSAGFTSKFPDAGLRLTLDGYLINIDDRVVLTGAFTPGNAITPEAQAELEVLFAQAGATQATFFANAIDTRSFGLEAVLSHAFSFGDGNNARTDLAAILSKTEQTGDINSSQTLQEAGLVETYFDQTSRIYLEQAVPRVKVSLSNTLDLGNFNTYLRLTYFGETTEATNADIFDADLELLPGATIDPYNAGKLIADLSIGYNFSEDLSLTLGANNLLDTYPDESDPSFQSSGRFVYSRRSPQFSFNGRHLFARLNFTLK